MVQVSVSGGRELQCAETDIVQRFVVEEEALVSVLNQLMEREHSVVGFHNSIADLGRRDDGESLHNAVWVLLADLRDEQSAHARTSATAQRMAHLEALEAVAPLCLLTHDIQDGVNQFSSLGVVPLRPVVSSASLTEDKVVRAE